jgi:hypothetical protein
MINHGCGLLELLYNMYTSINQYYLNKLGIIPWVLKNKAQKLIVLCNGSDTPEARLLLEQVNRYFFSASTNVDIIFSPNDDERLPLLQTTSNKILAFGYTANELMNRQDVVYCSSLNHLLQTPIDKKNLFLNLCKAFPAPLAV